jgi:hypothetical protein
MRQARWWLAVAVAAVGVAAVGSVAARAQEGERPAARPSAEAVRPTGGDEILSVLKRIEGRLADLEKEVFRLREENARLRWELGGRGGAPPRAEGERPLAEGDRPRAEGARPRAEGEGARPLPRGEGDRPRAEGEVARERRPDGEGARPLPRGEGDRPRGEGEVARERPVDGEGARPRAEGEGARPLPRGEGDRPKARRAEGTAEDGSPRERPRGEGAREGVPAALPPGVAGFRGVLVGTVAGLSDLNFTLRVSRVEKVYEQNKADNPQNLVGKTVPIAVGRGTRLAEQQVQTLKELKVGDRIQVEAFHLVGDSLTVMEELRKVAAEPGPEAR